MVNFYFKRLINSFFSFALTLIIPVCFIANHFASHSSYHNTNNSTSRVTAPAPVAACTLTDATISQCASSMVLNVDPGYSNYLWSTGATSNSITVTTSGTYWWETVRYDENATINSDFENSGNHYSGFTSSYTKNTSSLVAEGTYAVLKDPHSEHSSFATFNDHTKADGTGYMMVVNGASTANVTVWTEAITVQANTTYVFSVWGTSVTPASPGILNFSINGSLLGNITLNSTIGTWQNFTVRWSSGNSTTATIGIVNQNTAASGNDFALDDITFAPVCRKNITANLYPNPAKPIITN